MDQDTVLLGAFAKATEAIATAIKNKGRSAQHEANYSQAYQALVRAGLRPQLPRRMRAQYVPGHAHG